MPPSEPRTGISSFSGLAIVGQSGTVSKSKTVILDVEVFLGADKNWTLLGSLRFFNSNDIRFAEYAEGLLCIIKASFAQSPTDSALLGISQDEHSFIGDVHSIVPLERAHDPHSEPSPLFSPYVRPSLFLSGLALNRNLDASSFTLDIDVWVSASKESSNPSFKPTAPFLCIIPDSPRYKAYGKPIPYNRRFVSVIGTLSDVVYKKTATPDTSSEIERFVITVDEIVFLGQPTTSESSSTPAKLIPNTLDGTGTPQRSGKRFGFFKGNQSFSPKHGATDTSPSHSLLTPPATSGKRHWHVDDNNDEGPSATGSLSSQLAPPMKRPRVDNPSTSGPSTRSTTLHSKQSGPVKAVGKAAGDDHSEADIYV